jgi:hypothetical protein
LLDLVWLLGLHISAWFSVSLGLDFDHDFRRIHRSAGSLWNAIHLPVRRLIEPILIPVVIVHPQYPSDWVFYLYQTLCFMQSLLIGYVLGLLIRFVLRWKSPRSSD